MSAYKTIVGILVLNILVSCNRSTLKGEYISYYTPNKNLRTTKDFSFKKKNKTFEYHERKAGKIIFGAGSYNVKGDKIILSYQADAMPTTYSRIQGETSTSSKAELILGDYWGVYPINHGQVTFYNADKERINSDVTDNYGIIEIEPSLFKQTKFIALNLNPFYKELIDISTFVEKYNRVFVNIKIINIEHLNIKTDTLVIVNKTKYVTTFEYPGDRKRKYFLEENEKKVPFNKLWSGKYNQ